MPLDGVKTAVARLGLHDDCTGLILAVSGGADSMAMLRWYAQQTWDFPLIVAHVHHGLRDESNREERLVKECCNALSLPCHVFHTNVKSEMQKGETVESAARRLRYDFFQKLAKTVGASHLATAHTKDDQCETVLLHLLHGAGARGLGGILPKRQDGALTLIRPFLGVEKRELLSYCAEMGIDYAQDQSNDDVTYTRNKIRHHLLPVLEEINPNVRDALCRTAMAMQRQQQALEVRAQAFLRENSGELAADKLRALLPGEQAEVFRQFFAAQGKHLSFEQTNQCMELLDKTTGTVEFDRKYRLHLGQNRLTLSQEEPPLPSLSVTAKETPLPDGRILRLEDAICDKSNQNRLICAELPLTLRSRKEGDELRTPGGTKTLKKRMIELKIPQEDRNKLWVLTDGDTVLWCESVGINTEKTPKEGEKGYFVSLSAN